LRKFVPPGHRVEVKAWKKQNGAGVPRRSFRDVMYQSVCGLKVRRADRLFGGLCRFLVRVYRFVNGVLGAVQRAFILHTVFS
jgi:hypothetical protein